MIKLIFFYSTSIIFVPRVLVSYEFLSSSDFYFEYKGWPKNVKWNASQNLVIFEINWSKTKENLITLCKNINGPPEINLSYVCKLLN